MTRSNVISQFLTFLGFTFHLPADRAKDFNEAMEIVEGLTPGRHRWVVAMNKTVSLISTKENFSSLFRRIDTYPPTFRSPLFMAILRSHFKESYSSGDTKRAVFLFEGMWEFNGKPLEWEKSDYLYHLYKDKVQQAQCFEDLKPLYHSDLYRVSQFHDDWERIVELEMQNVEGDNSEKFVQILSKSRVGGRMWNKIFLKLVTSLDFKDLRPMLERYDLVDKIKFMDEEVFTYWLSSIKHSREVVGFDSRFNPIDFARHGMFVRHVAKLLYQESQRST